ncbi:50S ribosomal protein L17 [Candidatus Kaiserbacteria bacterium RIFCSPHIGHO2_01_FULL_49_13]|uniref:Large ribosomal subunit protein bL17 n=1 Tax=Candidatus Kaiserbacteria bacterium RIFCSPHIGHO2_01_FULL_49_13 TaxID=1798477 RepID=A0A1F6CCI5_9BACT|nr:MAG: 50S ribosomal protein L17 [Candidatus Kaiserbacteria bacterium RIFCSPHIGHO2_01_FULL_49_13]
MRHHKKIRKFGRERNERHALLRSLARSLIVHERIETTEARAKELRPMIERLLTRGKKGTLADRRLVSARLGGAPRETKKLFDTLAPKYKDRNGGYTRIIKIHGSSSDARKIAQISFV